jgi:hypothetical protein
MEFIERGEPSRVNDFRSNHEDYATQLHLFKIIISQRLVAPKPLALVDEDKGT